MEGYYMEGSNSEESTSYLSFQWTQHFQYFKMFYCKSRKFFAKDKHSDEQVNTEFLAI